MFCLAPPCFLPVTLVELAADEHLPPPQCLCVETRKIRADPSIDWTNHLPAETSLLLSSTFFSLMKSSRRRRLSLCQGPLTPPRRAGSPGGVFLPQRRRLAAAASGGTKPSATNEGNSSPELPRAVHPRPDIRAERARATLQLLRDRHDRRRPGVGAAQLPAVMNGGDLFVRRKEGKVVGV